MTDEEHLCPRRARLLMGRMSSAVRKLPKIAIPASR
jgi:hypothetical protein